MTRGANPFALEGCSCDVCCGFITICWTRLPGGVWVLSQREQLFGPMSAIAAVDSDGEAIWFVGDRS